MIQTGTLIRATGERIPATRREVRPGKIEIRNNGQFENIPIPYHEGDRFEVAGPQYPTPSPDDARRCMDYRERCKINGYYASAEQQHCEKMLKKFPEWYAAGNAETFNRAAAAIGSDAKYNEGK